MTVKELIEKLEACTDKEQEVIIENNEYSFKVKDVNDVSEYERGNAYISENEIIILPKYMHTEFSWLTDLYNEYYDLLSQWKKEEKEEVTYSQVLFLALMNEQYEMKRKIQTVKKCLENEKVSQ